MVEERGAYLEQAPLHRGQGGAQLAHLRPVAQQHLGRLRKGVDVAMHSGNRDARLLPSRCVHQCGAVACGYGGGGGPTPAAPGDGGGCGLVRVFAGADECATLAWLGSLRMLRTLRRRGAGKTAGRGGRHLCRVTVRPQLSSCTGRRRGRQAAAADHKVCVQHAATGLRQLALRGLHTLPGCSELSLQLHKQHGILGQGSHQADTPKLMRLLVDGGIRGVVWRGAARQGCKQ